MNANEQNPPATGADPSAQSEQASNIPQPASEAPAPAAPPAAQVVITAKRTEREVQLEQELEVVKLTQKQREQRINQLEDENHRLKSVPRSKSTPKGNWTLFHPEDED